MLLILLMPDAIVDSGEAVRASPLAWLRAVLAAAGIDPAGAAVDLRLDGPRPLRVAHRAGVPVHPASLCKLFFLAAAQAWLETGRLEAGPELERALAAMIRESSNDATSYVLDRLTGTTSGPELAPAALAEWMVRRGAVNRHFQAAGPFAAGCNLTQKTWADGPYGRERQGRAIDPHGGNRLSASAVADLLDAIAAGRAVSPARSAAMLALLERDLDPARRAPGDQVEGFLGAGLPPGSRLWSKSGWTSTLRHDAALVALPGGVRFRLVVLTEGRAASADARALPALAAAVVRDVER
ncbi:MAG: serine hydrolase [Dongiaceae bacterium]